MTTAKTTKNTNQDKLSNEGKKKAKKQNRRIKSNKKQKMTVVV